jgi:trehalose 6-phosphate synthase/phosphatase
VEHAEQWLTTNIVDRIVSDFRTSLRRLVLLDYDGTLVDFSPKPTSTIPDEKLLRVLHELSADQRNTVAIISGRGRHALERWLDVPGLALVAEHGALTRLPGEDWVSVDLPNDRWKESIRPVLERFVDRTPRSLVEEKEASLVWHYRLTDPELGPLRARELRYSLGHLTENLDLTVMEGNRVLEVKVAGVNKGRAARAFRDSEEWDFSLAIGDDRTDEDTFEAMPDDAYTVKVGGGASRARLRASSVREVRGLLEQLAR